jgi:hypothetical protein
VGFSSATAAADVYPGVVITDTGQQTTAYVKSDGEWFINCDRIRATGAVVLRWRDD